MENNDLVSAVMSVYNSEHTIKKSIQSLLNQDYSNIEILIIDDCSDDKTEHIIKELMKEHSQIKFIKNERNIGLTKSLNKLIKHVSGEYIVRQDGDDESEPNRVSLQLSYLKENKLDACTTRARVIGKNKVVPNLSFYLPINISMRFKNPFIHGSLMIKSKVLKEIGMYDENFYYAQDYKLMKDLLTSKYNLGIMREKLYLLNMNNNISSLHKEKQKYYADCVRGNITPKETFND
tara:strand:- start:985 stop:1689 length:705 start_codon:yes stop_codon:yes gene_type:complete